MSPQFPQTGGCRCGAVRFEVTKPAMLTMACHCTGCQRMSASAFSLSVAVPSDGFTVLQGETVLGGLRGDPQHFFCSKCLSWMFTRMQGFDFFLNVRATMFDDTSWTAPYIETYTSERLAWAKTPAVHSFEKFPPFDAYEELIREYASKT